MTGTSSSTRKLAGAAIALATVALFAGGCSATRERYADFRSDFPQRVRPSQYRFDPVLPDPAPDKATELRADWEHGTYLYPSGAALAYPTYNLNQEDRPRWLANDYVYSLAVPGIMIYDVLSAPVYMIFEPPTTAVTYHGSRVPPSMTVAPPLPPAQ